MKTPIRLVLPALLLAVAASPSAPAGTVGFTYTQTGSTGSGTISGTADGMNIFGTMPAATVASTYTPPPAVPASAIGAIEALSGDIGGNGVYLGWSGTTTVTGEKNRPRFKEVYDVDVSLKQVTGQNYSWQIDYADDLGAGFDLEGSIRAAAYLGDFGSGHRHTDTSGGNQTYTAGVADSYTYSNSLVPGGNADGDGLGIEAGLRDGTLTSGEILVNQVTYSGALETVPGSATLVGRDIFRGFDVALDVGPNGQDVQTGHIPITGPNANTNGTDLSPVLVTAGNVSFTVAIDDTDQAGSDVGGIDWRDRGNSPNSSNDLVDLGEDFVKNNAGIVRVTLSGLPEGIYDATSWHLDPDFDQSDAIRVFVDNGDGSGFVDTGVLGNADFDIGGTSNLDTDEVLATQAMFGFTADGLNDVAIVFDGRSASDTEVPLNGLRLVFSPVPEPSGLLLAAMGLVGLALAGRRTLRRWEAVSREV